MKAGHTHQNECGELYGCICVCLPARARTRNETRCAVYCSTISHKFINKSRDAAIAQDIYICSGVLTRTLSLCREHMENIRVNVYRVTQNTYQRLEYLQDMMTGEEISLIGIDTNGHYSQYSVLQMQTFFIFSVSLVVNQIFLFFKDIQSSVSKLLPHPVYTCINFTRYFCREVLLYFSTHTMPRRRWRCIIQSVSPS